MTRKNLLQLLPWALMALVMFTDLRTPVLGGLQRGLLLTGLWKADLPAAAGTPVLLASNPGYPHNLPLLTLDGRPMNLSGLKGKVVFVNLWASWCPPCMAEMPGIHALYRKMDPAKVAFVMISLDKNPDKARAIIQRKGYTFPVYFPTGPLPVPFETSSIPATLILDRAGQVVSRHEGMADYDTPELKAALEKLAAGRQ